VRHAVRRRLLADPALLVDAKALLVNAIRFVEKSKTPSPSPSSLARVRYHRDIKGDRRLPSGKAEQAEIASSVLSLEDLILTGITGTESLDQRLGFLEVLDDARYDNSFRPKKPEKAPGTFEADSFEAVVDPAGAPAWPAADPVVPMAAENTSGLRRVQLASLSPVKAPILLWAGEPGAELVGGLPNGGSGDGRYSLENLLARSSAAPAAGHTALVAAVPSFRRGDPKPTADADLAWAFYMAEGDEEGSQTDGFYDSFLNDGFFIRLSREMKQRPAARALAAMRGSDVFQEKARSLEPPTPEELEKAEANLRELLVASRGSAAAARALDALILQPAGGQAFERVLGTIVRQSALQPPDPAKHALVRIGNGKPPTPHQPEPGTMALDINDVFVFRRETAVAGAPQPVFILFSFRAEVWSPVELEFTQGRNLDYRPWGVAAGSGESEPDHVFASEFWQAAPQSAAPSRHALAKDFSNAALIWTRQGRYIAGLDGTWRGQVEVEALLKRLLLDRNVTIDGLQTSGSILSGTAQAKFSPPVQISVFHEQFDDEVLGSRTGPVGRFLLSSRRFASPKEKHDFFPPEYDHFSLDFAWYSSSGLALLRLGRIFVQFD
jgi:hypothetical protein